MKQRSRRQVLGAVGSVSVAAVAGCLGGGEPVRVLSAGSLAATVEDHVGPAFETATGTPVHGEYHGTNAAIRLLEDGTKRPDVFLSADATLLRDRLYSQFSDWDAAFATNTVGLAYDADTGIGQRLDSGEPWYELTPEADDGAIAIGHPNLDPLGYRAVMAFELAGRHHNLDGFREAMLDVVVREPDEARLLAGVETGANAAAIVYRNMASDHGLPFHPFPDAYSFAAPELAHHYATVEYTTDEGYTATGRPVLYSGTVLGMARAPDAGHRFVQFLADRSELLVDAGLSVPDSLPRGHGDVPEAIAV